MTLIELLRAFNFRRWYNDKKDTKIVRICFGFLSNEFIELGISEWGSKSSIELLKATIKPEILYSKISWFSVDEDNICLEIYLETEDDEDEINHCEDCFNSGTQICLGCEEGSHYDPTPEEDE